MVLVFWLACCLVVVLLRCRWKRGWCTGTLLYCSMWMQKGFDGLTVVLVQLYWASCSNVFPPLRSPLFCQLLPSLTHQTFQYFCTFVIWEDSVLVPALSESRSASRGSMNRRCSRALHPERFILSQWELSIFDFPLCSYETAKKEISKHVHTDIKRGMSTCSFSSSRETPKGYIFLFAHRFPCQAIKLFE